MRRSREMFQSAALKLTTYYLIIIMALSVGCSLALYRVYNNDLDRMAQRQLGYVNRALPYGNFPGYRQFRSGLLDEDLSHLRGNLVLFNLAVLVAGGWISYLLARRTLRPIEESMEAQSRFSSDASHELRTPLAVMQSEIEVALRDKNLDKKEAIGLLKSNLEEVEKLRNLSDGLLRLANQNGKPEASATANLARVAEAAIERVTKTAEAKKIQIDNQVKDLNVKGDQQPLSDLLVILLDNAIKYSNKATTIYLTSRKQGKAAALSVRDQGQGIPANELPHIFERFYRSDASRSKDTADGYGLGLAIAKKIAEAHDGSIEVKSAVGHGATFTLHIPIA